MARVYYESCSQIKFRSIVRIRNAAGCWLRGANLVDVCCACIACICIANTGIANTGISHKSASLYSYSSRTELRYANSLTKSA